jgi:plastocyanin
MKMRRRHLWLALLLSAALLLLFAAVGVAVNPTIEAAGTGGVYGGYYWLPSSAQVNRGGEVTFKNASTVVSHGVVWTGGPETPSCPGVPLNRGEMKWEGTCTFAHAGLYSFHCYVHPTEMTGSVTVLGTPTASTGQTGEVTQRSALANGSVDPEGQTGSYRFQYGALSISEHSTPVQSVGASDFTSHPLSASLTGLTPGTEYHVQLIVTYGAGSTVEGGERTFTTPPLQAPTVATGAATSIAMEGATLGGAVNPEGLETEYHFEYGLTTAYGSQTPTQRLGPEGGNHAVAAPLSGLAAGTVYHFRLVASNSQGSAVPGEDRTFETASAAPKEPPTEPPAKEPAPTPGPAPTPAPTPSPGPIPPEPELTPLAPTLVEGSLKLVAPRHSVAVHGSLQVSSAGAGSRLEVDLLAAGASLARRGHRSSKQIVVGRLVRPSVSAGKVSFSVALNARGKSALRRHRRLALTVRIVLTPPVGGKAVRLSRSVVLRA